MRRLRRIVTMANTEKGTTVTDVWTQELAAFAKDSFVEKTYHAIIACRGMMATDPIDRAFDRLQEALCDAGDLDLATAVMILRAASRRGELNAVLDLLVKDRCSPYLSEREQAIEAQRKRLAHLKEEPGTRKETDHDPRH